MNVLLFTALLVSSVWTLPSTKLRKHQGSRIIGGIDANAGQYPFAAAFYYQTNSGAYFCGGALVTNQWILTSASCVDGATLFSIRLGTAILDATGPNVVRVSTDSYVMHPDYNPDTLENDVGLIKLRLPVTFTEYVKAIALPGRDAQPNAVVTAIGWGQISDDDPGVVDNLQTVALVVLSNEECRLYFGNQIMDSMVCVDGSFNEGTCLGDTGTPLIQDVNGNIPTVVGVSSFISGNGCESTDPSGYTRVFPYAEWIYNTTSTV